MAIITGTTGDDNDLSGTNGDDTIYGLAGRDTLRGLDGDDRLEGGDGNDDVVGGAGDDLLLGGLGNDWLFETGGGENDQLFGEAGDDELRYLAAFTPTAFSALLNGGAGNDVLEYYSSDANDAVTILGGTGSDFIMATGGDLHKIDAGADSDLVMVSLADARSEVKLGDGADLLQVNAFLARPVGDAEIDVSDFQSGNSGDAVSLIQYLTVALGGWDQAANPFATRHLRLIQRGTDAVLQVDADGPAGPAAWDDLITYAGKSRTTLTAHNLGGYAADGSATAGRTLNGSSALDFLMGDSGDDTVLGVGGGDFLRGGAGDDRLEGGDGSDQLDGELGADLLIGGADNDTLSDSLGGWDRLFGGDGADSLYIDRQFLSPSRGDDNIYADGGPGTDYISYFGQQGLDNVRLVGGDHSDILIAFRGKRIVIEAGNGPDIVQIDVTAADYEISLGNSSDILQLSFFGGVPLTDFTVIDFTPGNGGDQIDWVGFLPNALIGWDPATNPFGSYLRLARSGGNAMLLLDRDGPDGGGGFKLFGTLKYIDPALLTAVNLGYVPGAIVTAGTNAANTISGTAAADDIFGLAGADILKGGGAGDRLDGGSGADRLEGGAGNDRYVVDNVLDEVIEASGGGTDTVYSSASSFTLPNHVENLRLFGDFSLDGIGNGLANLIVGSASTNELAGNDGNDRLDGGGGADTMIGGKGHDVYVVGQTGDRVIEDGSSGTDTVESAVSFTLPVHFEKLILTGSLGHDGRGNAGDNFITGNSGGNFLNGGSGNDVIDAGAGNDRILGGLGNDSLKGGTGTDRFEFTTALGAANVDTILDFSVPADTIQLLRSIFAEAGANGTLAAAAFHQGASAADAGDRIVYDQATGRIFYDADGTGAAAATLFATVTPGTALTNADFVIYG